jgi:hypothetical protein
MKKVLIALLFAGLVNGFWGASLTNANDCESGVANDLGYKYGQMAKYLEIDREPNTFDHHKNSVWPDFKVLYNKAITAGLSDSCKLLISNGQKSDGVKAITFGALKEKYSQWADIMEKPGGEDKIIALSQERSKASDDKAFGAHYKALSGDKLKEFKKCKNCGWYTTGKKQLSTAKEFKNASLWCTEAWSSDGTGRWKVDCMRFNGNKRVKDWTKSGTGSTSAPASAFK